MLPVVNQVVYLSSNHKQEFPLKTRIADINNQYISIEVPINETTGKLEKLPVGRRIVLFYQSKDHGQYMFDTTVMDEAKDQIDLLILQLPDPNQIKKAQRRNFLRVPASIETSFHIVDSRNNEWFIVKTLDLSGGGMQIILSNPNLFKEGLKLKGWIVLSYPNEDNIEHVQYQAEIIRILSPNENTKVKWASLNFTSITETSRAKIIRYCYQRQVYLRKKGMI
ncbi:PilZ domain-containing protein [Tepidibacillus marianensis]|uniref:flagellar brake protein n=1 Tax=Tepidibacillus marianensis TaxID=3131995 RepID=UPI0030D1CE31